jgi:hypothetical protein
MALLLPGRRDWSSGFGSSSVMETSTSSHISLILYVYNSLPPYRHEPSAWVNAVDLFTGIESLLLDSSNSATRYSEWQGQTLTSQYPGWSKLWSLGTGWYGRARGTGPEPTRGRAIG